MEENERKVAFDFRQPLAATHWRRVSAVSIFLAPIIATAYAVSIHEQCHNPCSVSIHAVSRAARLFLTEVFVIGLFAAVSPHEPTGSAKMVALACMVTGVLFSLLAAFDRWSQPSASEGEHAIRVGIPSAIFFLWLWLLYAYYWRQSCAAWEGFRLCAAAANCMRLVGVLLLRFAVSPAVTSYPPGQLPFESACACNLLLMLVPAALTPPNRMRLALASGLQTVSLSQLHPGHGAVAQPPQLGDTGSSEAGPSPPCSFPPGPPSSSAESGSAAWLAPTTHAALAAPAHPTSAASPGHCPTDKPGSELSDVWDLPELADLAELAELPELSELTSALNANVPASSAKRAKVAAAAHLDDSPNMSTLANPKVASETTAGQGASLQEVFVTHVMCDYTLRFPSQLPKSKWASCARLLAQLQVHAPSETSQLTPDQLKQRITGWYHPAYAGLSFNEWGKKLKDRSNPHPRARHTVFHFPFEYTPRGAGP